MSRDSF